LGATVSALTVSALGLLGAGTFRHRPYGYGTGRSALALDASAATLHNDTNNTFFSQLTLVPDAILTTE